MINLSTLPYTIEELQISIKNKIKHNYIDQFIKDPVLDEDKLYLLSLAFSEASMPIEKKQDFIIATMLVQLALDTHETVENQTNNTAKQLTVLAGDYYSGLYYSLLSEINELEFINVLAKAIKEINELKMKLYFKDIDSVQEYLQTMLKINSLLVTVAANYTKDSILANISGELLYTKYLVEEKQLFMTNGNSAFILNCNHYFVELTETEILHEIDKMIQKNTLLIDSTLSSSPFHLTVLQNNLKGSLDPLVAHVKEG